MTMRECGHWVVCGALLVAQLGCRGEATSGDGGGPAAPSDEPGSTPGAAVESSQPLTPGSSEPATPSEQATSDLPAAPGERPAFNDSDAEGCKLFPEHSVDTPLDDTRGTGFSALEMLTLFNEQGPGLLTWRDGTTTTLSITARVAGSTSSVDDPPRGEGFCVPFRSVPVEVSIQTADGRLAEDVVCQLVAVGYDGNVESIWVGEARLPLADVQGNIEIPSDWLIASHTERRLDFDTAWVAPGALSPYCTSSDAPSTDAGEDCNVYTGVVRFFSSGPFPELANDPAGSELRPGAEYFRGVVGTWILAP